MDGEHQRNPLDQIRSIEANEIPIRMLVGQLQKPLGVTPFVGAGLSRAFGFPSWDSFLLDYAETEGIKERIQQRLDAKEYEEAAEELKERGPNRFHAAIRFAFSEDNIEDERLDDGAVFVLPEFPDGPVITTNFDRVLEKAFERAGQDKRFEVVIWGVRAEPALRGFQQSRRILLKVHGDVEAREDRIFTMQDYEKYYGSADFSKIDFRKPLPRLLRNIFMVRPVLFIGCSLEQDRTMDLLTELASGETSTSDHFAIVARPESPEQIEERSRFLDRRNILPIWYPCGRHDLIKPLLEYLVNQSQAEKPRTMNISIKEPDLEIYLTGQKVRWGKDPQLKYRATPEGYLLADFRTNDTGPQFKHFVVCNNTDEEKERIKNDLRMLGYDVTGDGSQDDDPKKWQIWFLDRDYPILKDNNVWCGL